MPDSIYTPTKEHFYVYLYCNPLKNDLPFYVGKGKGKRAFVHLNNHSDTSQHAAGNPHKHRTITNIRRAGLEPTVYCLWDGASESHSLYLEKFFIAMFGRKLDGGILCNLSKGGEGNSGLIHSDETRAKMSKRGMGRTLSLETRAKISSAQKGKKISLEARAKQSATMTGRKPSQETRAKMRAAHIARMTPELRAQISAAVIARMTPETRAKIAESGSKLWLVTFPDGHQEEIKNLRAFTRQKNLTRKTLLRGGTCKGFKAQRLPTE